MRKTIFLLKAHIQNRDGTIKNLFLAENKYMNGLYFDKICSDMLYWGKKDVVIKYFEQNKNKIKNTIPTTANILAITFHIEKVEIDTVQQLF